MNRKILIFIFSATIALAPSSTTFAYSAGSSFSFTAPLTASVFTSFASSISTGWDALRCSIETTIFSTTSDGCQQSLALATSSIRERSMPRAIVGGGGGRAFDDSTSASPVVVATTSATAIVATKLPAPVSPVVFAQHSFSGVTLDQVNDLIAQAISKLPASVYTTTVINQGVNQGGSAVNYGGYSNDSFARSIGQSITDSVATANAAIATQDGSTITNGNLSGAFSGAVNATTLTASSSIITPGLAITSTSPATTTNLLYQNGSALYWNGSPLSVAGGATWGNISGPLSSQTDLQNALNLKFNLADWAATTSDALAEGISHLYFTTARASTTATAVLSATTSLPQITTLAGLTSAPNLTVNASHITSGTLPAVTLGGFVTGNNQSLTGLASLAVGTTSSTSSSTLLVVGTTTSSSFYIPGTSSGSGTFTFAGVNGSSVFNQEITHQVSGNNATLLFNLNHGALPGSNEINTIRFNGPNTSLEAVNANDALGIKQAESFNTGFLGLVSTGGANGSVPSGGFLLSFALSNTGKVGSVVPTTSYASPNWRNVLDDGSGNASFTGNVGIGTTSPGQKLDVWGTSRVSNSGNVSLDITGNSITSNNPAGQSLDIVTGALTSSFISNGFGGNTYSLLSLNSSRQVGIASNNKLNLFTNGNNIPSFTIDTSGNVGIGTTAPGGTLHVYNSTPTTGTTKLIVQAGAGDVTASYIFDVRNNAGTTVASVRPDGLVGADILSTQDIQTAALNDRTFSGYAQGLNFNSTALAAWSSTSYWYDTKDTGISRISANKVGVGNGTTGDYSGTLIAGNVGIGTTTPSGQLTIAPANQQIALNLIPSTNYGAGLYFGTGVPGALGAGINSPGNSTELHFTTGNVADRMTINYAGNVGIGTTSPAYQLSVAGTVGFSGLTNSATGNYVCIAAGGGLEYSTTACSGLSSQRYKHDITTISTNALDEVSLLRPVSFVYNSDVSPGDQTTHLGFVAEEINTIDPRLVAFDAQGLPLSVKYQEFVPILAKAIQEQQAEIVALQSALGTASSSAALASSSTFVASIVSAVKNSVAASTDWVFAQITAVTGVFTTVQTNGIEMKSPNGQLWCVRAGDTGVLMQTPGSCASSATAVAASSLPSVPYVAPVVVVPSVPAPAGTSTPTGIATTSPVTADASTTVVVASSTPPTTDTASTTVPVVTQTVSTVDVTASSTAPSVVVAPSDPVTSTASSTGQ